MIASNFSRPVRRFIFWQFASALVVLGSLAGCAKSKAPSHGGGGGAAPVVVGKVERKVMPVVLNAIGAVEPIRTAGVRSQVTGILLKINFQEGQEVKQGDLLFEIDPRPFQNDLRQAEADLEKARVQHDTALSEVARYRSLSEQGMVSKEQFQTILDNERTLQAQLGSAQAAIANDRLQLEYCSIRAPISGRTGSVGAHEGDLVRASDANIALVVINQVSPIYVTFSVPQQNLEPVSSYQAAGTVNVTAIPPGSDTTPEKGALTFLDNTIDATTGTLKLKASFPNDDRRLWPGQFANVAVTLASPTVLIAPMGAVQNSQKGQYVYVVKSDMTAEERPVTLERNNEDFAVISTGLSEGETVVVDGQLRVLPGKTVQIKTGGNPSAEAPGALANAASKGKAKAK